MKKRLLAALLALAMVLSVVPASVSAEPEHDNAHPCKDGSCGNATIEWKPWTGVEKSGHYYLTGDVKLNAAVSLASGNDLHLCLNGHNVSGQDKTRLFALASGAKLTVSDCTTKLDGNGKFVSGGGLVDGYHASVGGAGIYNNGGTVVLLGIQLSGHNCGCTATDGWAGSAIHARGTGTVTVKNCYFTDNAGIEGAAVTLRQDAVMTATDTVFRKNSVTGNGGAIFVCAGNSTAGKGAKLTATNCAFTENSAVNGGGAVYLKKDNQAGTPTVTLDGCTLTGNTNSGNGGSALHIKGNVVMTLKDTTVTGNISTNAGGEAWRGALCQDNAASRYVLTGKVIIDDNFVKNGAIERNILLQYVNSKVGIDNLAAGSSISILTKNWNTDFTYNTVEQLLEVSQATDLTAWDPAWVYYEDNESFVYYDSVNKLLRFAEDPSHFHCLCGDATEDNCDHSKVIWIPWGDDEAEKGKLPVDSGSYYLVSDITLTQNANLSTNDDIRLCLNGKTVKVDYATAGQVQDTVYYMTRNGKLTISDCTAATVDGVYTAGKLTGGSKGVLSMNKLNDNATENTLVIYDGILTGNTNTTDGGAVNMTAGKGSFTMYGGEISGNTAQGLAGAINAAKGSTVHIYGGTIRDNTAVKNGGAISAVEATLQIHGGTFSGNTGDNGAALYLNGATVQITGGQFDKNTAKTAGGVAAISNGSTVTISGGTFTDNTAPNGGALCAMSNSQVTLSGGSFTGNTVTNNGAALYVSRTAHLTLSGGTLSQNTAGVHGGGIYVDYDGLLTLTGGTITGNTAGTTGGGVSIHQDGVQLAVSGSPVITDNLVGSSKNNLHLRGDACMQVGTMEKGARVSLTADALPRFVSGEVTGDPVPAFACDQTHRELTVKENKLYLDFSGEHQHCFCAGSDKNCAHTNVRWAAWEATDALPTESGSYYLLSDVVLPQAATLRTGADVRLCLNGHTVRVDHAQTLTENDRVFILRNDAKLTLSDCTAATVEGKYTAGKLTGGTMAAVILHGNASATFHMYDGIITGNSRADNVGGGVILRETTGQNVFNMYDGEISDNWAKGNGGGLYVKEGCTFNMYGGSIRGNKSTTFHGGGIAIVKDGTVNIYGGDVSSNIASKNGGGIFVQEGTLNIFGGFVDNNTAGSNGGGISAITGKVNISGGSVSANTAKTAAGAVSLSTKTSLKLSGGQIYRNNAQDAGAVCIMSNSVMTMTGGSVGYNTAKANAGGIYVSKTGQLTMSGGSVHHNSCPRNGGGVFLNNARFDFRGGDISYNTTETASGGILIGSNSVVTMTGGLVQGNKSIRGAGAVIQGKATLNMYGGKFRGNIAEIEAGAIYVSPNSFFTLHDGEFYENEAAYRGGALLANAEITIAGGDIHHNKVTGSEKYTFPYAGGVVIIGENNKTITMTGGRIRENYSAGAAGGMRINYLNTLIMTGGSIENNVAERTTGGLELYGNAKIKDVSIIGNKTGTVAGGLRAMPMVVVEMENVTFRDNEAATRGGAMYLNKGSWTTLKDCTITGNVSGAEGGAIFSWDELTLDGCTITDNTAGGNGTVYLSSANYDGQSYVLAVPKIAGDLRIEDNKGPWPGLYFEEGAVAAVASQGLGPKAKLHVSLADGVLTNTLFGSYDYEGGGLAYIVTFGDRSETEYEEFSAPEAPQQEEAPEQTEQPAEEKTDWLLYAGVGVIVLLVIGGAVLLLKKKKQPEK